MKGDNFRPLEETRAPDSLRGRQAYCAYFLLRRWRYEGAGSFLAGWTHLTVHLSHNLSVTIISKMVELCILR